VLFDVLNNKLVADFKTLNTSSSAADTFPSYCTRSVCYRSEQFFTVAISQKIQRYFQCWNGMCNNFYCKFPAERSL